MAKPRGSFERSNKIVKRLRFAYTKIKEIQIAAWSPDDEGEAPPEQVHLMVSVELPPRVRRLVKNPLLLIRFKSPDTLGFLIEEMARYRRLVWPGAEPLDLSGAPAQDETT